MLRSKAKDNFFLQIDDESFAETKSISANSVPLDSATDSGKVKYRKRLLKILNSSDSEDDVKFICQEGKSIFFPRLLLRAAWPALGQMIMESCESDCEQDIALSVPCSYRTGVLLRNMMLSNQVPKISYVERHNVLAFITDIGYSTNLFEGTVQADEELSENCLVELDEDCFFKSTIESNIERNCCSISCQHNCFMSVCREKENLILKLFSDEKLSVRKKN